MQGVDISAKASKLRVQYIYQADSNSSLKSKMTIVETSAKANGDFLWMITIPEIGSRFSDFGSAYEL